MRMVLLCYAEGSGNAWEGICVNFDVAVQGNSAQDVMNKLESAVKDYLDYVHTLPADEQKRFLSRHAPWYVSLKLAVRTLFAWLCHRRDTEGRYS